ncbi:MAG: hypothetical protein Kow00127_09250 [Bacteroidales bacterium]
MQKRIQINLGGERFYITPEALNLLEAWMKRITDYFRDSESSDEIISDIEHRIAELFREDLKDPEDSVEMKSVQKVITTIGTPEEMGGMEEPHFSGNQKGPEPKSAKRFYRNPDDKLIAGVCSGFGAYFGMDPVWIRLIFIILAVLGVGISILVYIIMWLVVPEARTQAEKNQMYGKPFDFRDFESQVHSELNHLQEKFNQFAREIKQKYQRG